MKILYVLPLMLAIAACDKPKERTESHVESSEITAVGTFSGDDIKATVAGDRVEIRNREVFINDISFGSVPAGAKVEYKVDASGRELIVGGETRALQK